MCPSPGLQAFSCDCCVRASGSSTLLCGFYSDQDFRTDLGFMLVSYMPLASSKISIAQPGSSIRCDAERLPDEQGQPASLVQQAQAASQAAQPVREPLIGAASAVFEQQS